MMAQSQIGAAQVARETPNQPEVAALLAASDAYSRALYPPESNHLIDLEALMAANVCFFVARQDGKAVGCGALVVSAQLGYGELKRMWVAPDARGKGIGRRLLAAIEHEARRKLLPALRLETGIRQPEAINLYRNFGFRDCEPFGTYKPDPLSIFMEKTLEGTT